MSLADASFLNEITAAGAVDATAVTLLAEGECIQLIHDQHASPAMSAEHLALCM